MQITLAKEGLLARGALQSWSAKVHDRKWRAVGSAMRREGAQLAGQVRAHVQTALKGKTVANSIRHKVYDRNKSRLPALQIKSKIPWLRVHETGRTLSGKMLIPFGSKRMRKGQWQKFLDKLFADERGFFIKTRGKTILMAKPAGKGDQLTRYRKSYREKLRERGAKTRIARNRPIPVAILVTRVTIKKRLNADQLVHRGLPRLLRGVRLSDGT